MRTLPIYLACLGLALLPLTASAKKKETSPQSYVELGLGISQNEAVDKTSTVDKLPTSFVGKALIGGKIAPTSHIWYELMYNYGGKTKYSDTNFEFSSHSVSTGIKVTTTPYMLLSGFARLGGGKTRFSTSSNGTSSSGTKNQYYLGLGASYRLKQHQFLVLDFQRFHYFDIGTEAIDRNNNSVYLTFQQYLR